MTDQNNMRKRGLGRGLDALFGEAKDQYDTKLTGSVGATQNAQAGNDGAAERQTLEQNLAKLGEQVKKLPITKLTSGIYQPRKLFDEEAIVQLSQSIKVHGILQPILVRPIGQDMYEIVAGERRWRAAQRVPLHEVPVIIKELDDKKTLEIALIENLQRADLSPIEEAEGYQRLIDEFFYTHEELAEQIGKSRASITNSLRLLRLPSAVQDNIHSGALSMGHAKVLLAAKNPEDLMRDVMRRHLNVRALEKLVQEQNEVPEKKTEAGVSKAKDDINIKALEESLQNTLGVAVTIESKGSKGKITLHYATLEECDALLEKLMA
jgi:ParB family chromosome partitioning protein